MNKEDYSLVGGSMQTFTFHATFKRKSWESDFRIIAVKANSESEALGLILDEYTELKKEDLATIEDYAELKPLQVEEIMQDYWSK